VKVEGRRGEKNEVKVCKMKKDKIISIIKNEKVKLSEEGFIIKAITGSFVKKNQYNDIDILYDLDDKFIDKYLGFKMFKKLEEIKKSLSNKLKNKIDLISVSGMNEISKKYMLKDIINV